MNNRFKISSVATSWGNITIETKEQRIVRCSLPVLHGVPSVPFKIIMVYNAPSAQYVSALLLGKNAPLPAIELTEGTLFQRSVWKGIQSIPWGKTMTYTALAERIGVPRAVRALANACGKNPLPLFIPCHRVTGSRGTLGGFSAGIAWKDLLLERESAHFY